MITDATHRWNATAIYNNDGEEIRFNWNFDNLHELEVLVENGPNWNYLEKIEVVYAFKELGS